MAPGVPAGSTLLAISGSAPFAAQTVGVVLLKRRADDDARAAAHASAAGAADDGAQSGSDGEDAGRETTAAPKVVRGCVARAACARVSRRVHF